MNTVHERPGVYSSYDASAVLGGGAANRVIGVVADIVTGALGTVGKPVTLTSYAAGEAEFGAGSAISLLLERLFSGGASKVIAVGMKENSIVEDYKKTFALLEKEENLQLIICDSQLLTVQQALRDSVERASANRRERLAVIGASETVTALIARAAQLNSERVILVAPDEQDSFGNPMATTYAAVAAAIAVNRDPALPLNGVPLPGLFGVHETYSENDLDLLIRGGVTPVECVGGVCSPVRCVTTRTKTGEWEDPTWREINTILIVDDVIPGIRATLHSKFARSKNTVQSRGAIRSQVIVELQNKLRAEIIDGYGEVRVSAEPTDPTVCLVEFDFTVAHGLNQIHLTAHITV